MQLLKNPSTDEFRKVLDSWQPNIVYLQGERLSDDEVGSPVWGGVDLSSVEAISGLFSATLPTAVCDFPSLVLFRRICASSVFSCVSLGLMFSEILLIALNSSCNSALVFHVFLSAITKLLDFNTSWIILSRK